MFPHVHIDEQVFLLLGQAYAQAKRMADTELRKLDVTHAEYSLLRVLENSPGITASAIRTRLSISAPAVAQLMKSVERKKLITRMADTDDSRRQFVTLTRVGKALTQRARGQIQKALESLGADQKLMKTLARDLAALSSVLNPPTP